MVIIIILEAAAEGIKLIKLKLKEIELAEAKLDINAKSSTFFSSIKVLPDIPLTGS